MALAYKISRALAIQIPEEEGPKIPVPDGNEAFVI
jgi:hypothetical protein|tara:strand:+ start:13319 stop:13423 length:105 start_codon:yes stop_codon:yes gene_type:complete